MLGGICHQMFSVCDLRLKFQTETESSILYVTHLFIHNIKYIHLPFICLYIHTLYDLETVECHHLGDTNNIDNSGQIILIPVDRSLNRHWFVFPCGLY